MTIARGALAASILLWAQLLSAQIGAAQGTQVQLGPGEDNSDQPVEVTSDEAQFDRDAGTARFTGDVLVVQGTMRLNGDVVDVFYGPGPDGENRIERVRAVGNVVLVNGPEAAEGDEADYSVETGEVVLTGDVLLTQGENLMTGERLRANVDDGTGVMEGRVRVLFLPENETGGSGQ
jgi:lipopolysaccharide export system protein LptA